MKRHYKNSGKSVYRVEDLLDAMATTDTFSHLQVMLRHQPEAGSLPQRFLMVTHNGFGPVNLVDLQYCNDNVILHLQDLKTHKISEVPINIYDTSFKFLLLNWQDIVEMIVGEKAVSRTAEGLLELDL